MGLISWTVPHRHDSSLRDAIAWWPFLYVCGAGSDEVLRGKTDDPHVATGLLKLFLRELPQPLLTEQLADRFIAVMGSYTLPSLFLTLNYTH